MAVLTSKLIIELLDRASGPARAVAAAVGRLSAMQTRNAAALAATQAQMFGAVAAAYGLKQALSAPVTAASEFETTMLDIGQKADMSDAAIAALGKRIRDLAPIVNKSSAEVAKGVDALIGFGLDPDRAMTLMEPIAKAATAYRAEVEDLAKAGYAALDNLKVPADQFGKALDAMAQAGKEGAFELKDMAREFPVLTAGAQALGMTGVTAVGRLAAAVEIARKGASDGASAATNVSNLMQKIISPETTKKFKAVGIDIRAELKKTQKSGGDVFEMIDRLLKKATKGDQSKIVDFFQDAEVQKFIRPLWQNIEEYRRIRDEALKATGIVEKDFKRRMLTNAAVTEAFRIRLRELGITIGNTLLPGLNRIMDAMRPMLQGLERFAAANPKVVSTAIALASALIGLRIAGIAAKFALLWLWGGALATGAAAMKGLAAAIWIAQAALLPFGAALRAARSAMIGFAAAAAIVGTGGALKIAALAMLGLLNPIRLVSAALVALRFALIGTGIGAVLLGIAAAGAFIYNNWSGISAMFAGFGAGFMAGIAPVLPALQPLIDAFVWLKDKITGAMGAMNIAEGSWRNFGTTLGAAVGGAITAVITKISELPGRLASLGSEVSGAIRSSAAGMYDAGMQLIAQLWEGMKAKVKALLGWVAGIGGQIRSAIGGAAAAAGSGAGGGGAGAGGVAGARAAGGPVRAGLPYLVGERGREIFQPDSGGTIIDAAETGRWLAAIQSIPGRVQALLAQLASPQVRPRGVGQLPDFGSLRDVVAQAGAAGARRAGGGGGGVVNHNSFSVSVQASPGQSTEQIADAVVRRLSDRLNALSRGAYSDGAYA